jgi:two-component system, NarL family, response regulator LiaR
MNTIRILMVDDHRMFLQSLRTLLEMEPGIEVVGECTRAEEALAAVTQTQPDVVLMDLNMPDVNGMELTRRILADRPSTAIIILTMEHADARVFQAIKSGARGYILKDSEAVDVVRTIRAVVRGESVVDPALTSRVFNEFQRMMTRPAQPDRRLLTDREIELLRLIVAGYSNKEIGAALSFSEKTIKNYISTILHKLQLSDRTQAAVYAIQNGLVDPPATNPPQSPGSSHNTL